MHTARYRGKRSREVSPWPGNDERQQRLQLWPTRGEREGVGLGGEAEQQNLRAADEPDCSRTHSA
jgi:hypothetical protein